MHKVRQFFLPQREFTQGDLARPLHQGPDGAPLLIGPKAQAIT
jgi:hypothetical protein